MIYSSEDISKTFCIMPWAGIATNPAGGLKPCCWINNGDSYRGTVAGYKNSDYLKNIKKALLDGKYPNECKICKENDDNDITSKRINENKKWTDLGNDWNNYDKTKYFFVDLRLSNRCNLGCMTCSSMFSSFIKNEADKNKGRLPSHWANHHIDDTSLTYSSYSDDDIDEILHLIAPNAQIYCTGGEPSLDKRIIKLLEMLIEQGYHKTVLLKFNSNFQSLNKKWISLLKKFNGRMYPSIDGIGNIAEYIRYPCNWKQVNENVNYFIEECKSTWTVEISPTISILSIFHVRDIIDWTHFLDMKHGLGSKIQVYLGNRLRYPNFFDIRNIPNNEKEDIAEILKQLAIDHPSLIKRIYVDDTIKHLYMPSTSDMKKTTQELDKLDKMRGTSWRSILTELARIS